MKGKYTFNYFLCQEDVGCVCMLNDWIRSNDGFLRRPLQLLPVQVDGLGSL